MQFKHLPCEYKCGKLPLISLIPITPSGKHFANFLACFPVTGSFRIISGISLYEAVANERDCSEL